MPTSSKEVRQELVNALRMDLVGPDNEHAFSHELLPQPPSRWYLTGFLVPVEAPNEQRTDETAADEIDSGEDAAGLDDTTPPDRAPAKRGLLPSSMGLTVLLPGSVKELEAKIFWGDYGYEGGGQQEPGEDAVDDPATQEKATDQASSAAAVVVAQPVRGYRRIPRNETVSLQIPNPGEKPREYPIKDSAGLVLVVTCRALASGGIEFPGIPKDALSISVFLVNKRRPNLLHAYKSFVFQTRLTLNASVSYIGRPDPRGAGIAEYLDEWDELVSDLQYRDVFEYSVGHGVSATALRTDDGKCFSVSTSWIPSAEVERVEPAKIANVELGIEALGNLASAADAEAKLMPLVTQYREWIVAQRAKNAGLDPKRQKTAQDLLRLAEVAASRVEAGIKLLADPMVIEAFRIANKAMGRAARQREAILRNSQPASVPTPTWRPFQLAFILTTLQGIADPQHDDRKTVDLLFFPTGGGKTEAYLGLAAFTIVLRRLKYPGIRSAGMSVLMRYTLRLLTLDQLGRAAALMCALELEREQNKAKLGEWPFEIGLWVGAAATPNRMGGRGYNGPGKDKTAYIKTRQYKTDSKRNPAPIPIENCPWCGTKFESNSFLLVPNEINPLNLKIHCVNHHCDFSGDRQLPIVGVDEPIYRRLPSFIIATVDKFAALPWTGQTGALLGLADRYDKDGFYGAADPGKGSSIGGALQPPDLIIQDELHLISGPLGTIAGVYETAIDALASRTDQNIQLRPKIIASTATVRRASAQIRALFDRYETMVFPPPGPDRRDSFFAKTELSQNVPARQYIGVAAQGRSLKVVLLRTALSILSAAQTIYAREGGKKNKQNPVDPYMTLLSYFNSLRELGGSRRIFEDEVRTRVAQYSRRKRKDPADGLFVDRSISYEVLELTSRVSTNDVAAAKRRLTLPFHEDERVDVALATNMISVGLDIVRLGLMVVLGQPKTSAEYIQATSRVGRSIDGPGLVITLLNIHKPRDRSHYERFETYHATFYRSIEAASVTPFSPRALDRALPAALVALCRHGNQGMTLPTGASEILNLKTNLDQFAIRFAERARNNGHLSPAEAQVLRDHVLQRCRRILDDWFNIAHEFRQTNVNLQYQQEVGAAQRLLYEPLNPELSTLPPVRRRFKANRSMRDVEPNVEIQVKRLNDWGNRS